LLYDPAVDGPGATRGDGSNGPPAELPCPGRQVCTGTCGQRSVHAEVRALRAAALYTRYHGSGPWDLIHVELGEAGGVVFCSGPSCWQCAREILDVRFVGGVWLYELGVPPDELAEAARNGIACLMRPYWRRYSAAEFYRITLERCGMVP
jgi:hypothetical protein